MTEDYKVKLQKLLQKLFQFDTADLDFGIYRIMNQKREEIEKFINEDLIATVNAEFEKYSMANKEEIEKELKQIKKKIEGTIGIDAISTTGKIKEEYKTLPIAKEYYDKKEELKASEISNQQKAEIFSHIYNFFSRYYQDGDFISLRRYSKQNKYAIPYNGEEVILYWANNDQYYIKTGEYFKNYSFNASKYKLNFRLSDAETEQNSNKSEKRFFVLKEGEENIVFDGEKKELTIFFEYRRLNDEENEKYGARNVQEKIIASIKDVVLDCITDSHLKEALKRIKDDSKKPLLEKHLNIYTKRNTTDYFIHKDLKGFLERELDFYIKNEVLMLDDLCSEKEVSIERYITGVKVIKAISQKIIEFLAQVEDFQKKLWEKKKFVIKTDYCMTLDKVPEEFYEEIVQNDDQINEWKDLFKLEEIEKGTLNYSANNGLKIDVDYLKSHPYLVLDTKFFNRDFKDKLLATFEDLDGEIGGVMIKSENFHALNLLLEKYKEKIKCIYIDPPYNTGSDEFIYKDNYQHSSWLSMMADRISLTGKILNKTGVFFTSIDDGEQARLKLLLDDVFGANSFLADVIWHARKSVSSDAIFSLSHHHTLVYFRDAQAFDNVKISFCLRPNKEGFENPDNDPRGPWKVDPFDAPNIQPNLTYPIKNPNTGEVFWPPEGRCWRTTPEQCKHLLLDNRIVFGKTGTAKPQLKRFWSEAKDRGRTPTTIWSDVDTTTRGTQEVQSLFGYKAFNNPKPVKLISKILELSDKNIIILDFFAGSGTTAHAVLNLNDEDKGNRKYILVEMGDYFSTVMKPRIQKVMFSSEWKNGIPQSKEGVSHMFKYMYLEQYEDSLNNIEFMVSGAVQKTLKDLDGYFLRYMIDFETRDSPTRLDVDKLNRPFEYKMKITNKNEIKEEVIDLVETFNYLLGLHVKQIRTFKHNGVYYKVIFGEKEEDTIAIIWRNIDDLDFKADKDFIENTILKDFEAQKVYVNGDSYLEGALPIEPKFKKLMGG